MTKIPAPAAGRARRLPQFSTTTEEVVLAASLFWAFAFNRAFLNSALHAQPLQQASSWTLLAGLAPMLVALHALLLSLVSTRRTVKPLVALLTVVGTLAMHYTLAYGVVIDPSMMRNALYTDVAEARELLSWRLALDLLLYAALPIVLLGSLKIEARAWTRSLKARALLLGGALAVLVLALMWQFQPLSALTRNQREMRYLVTPANALWSLGSVLAADARGAAQPRQAIPLIRGIDADLLFERQGMTVRGRRGTINGARIAEATPRIPNLGHDATLNLNGQVTGVLGDMLGYVNASPVAGWIGNITRGPRRTAMRALTSSSTFHCCTRPTHG